jgi:hypothetical protein
LKINNEGTDMSGKKIIVIEPEPGRTFEELRCGGGRVLRSPTGPPLSVFTSRGAVTDCLAMVDGDDNVLGWLHGTDCSMSRTIGAAQDDGLPTGAPLAMKCARREAGGVFETMRVPE